MQVTAPHVDLFYDGTTNTINYVDENKAIAKMTARYALYMNDLKISTAPEYAHGYFPEFLMSFCSIDGVNMGTKFEVRSFTRS